MRWFGRALVTVAVVLCVAAICTPGYLWQLGATSVVAGLVGLSMLGQAYRRDIQAYRNYSSREKD